MPSRYGTTTPCDPMAVAVDWLDAYRCSQIDQIVGMHRPDAEIECGCRGRKIINGREAIAACWRHRLVQSPAQELQELRMYGDAVLVSYRTSGGMVQALLNITDDGLISRCRCGNGGYSSVDYGQGTSLHWDHHHAMPRTDWPFLLPLAAMTALAAGAISILLFAGH